MRPLQCLAKEAPRSGRIALAAQKEIDRLPSAVNGTVKICPPTLTLMKVSSLATNHLSSEDGVASAYRSQAQRCVQRDTVV